MSARNKPDDIAANITLKELQEYVWQVNKERGFNLKSPSKKLVMLMEEVGELAKAIRKQEGLKFTSTTTQTDVAEELADVLIVLLGLASILKVDIQTAVAEKEAKNRKRQWR